MKLAQTKSLRMLNHHDRGALRVHPNFNNSGPDQKINSAVPELFHDPVFFIRRQAAVDQAHMKARGIKPCQLFVHLQCVLQIHVLRSFNHRTYDDCLLIGGHSFVDRIKNFSLLAFVHDEGFDRLVTFGIFLD